MKPNETLNQFSSEVQIVCIQSFSFSIGYRDKFKEQSLFHYLSIVAVVKSWIHVFSKSITKNCQKKKNSLVWDQNY